MNTIATLHRVAPGMSAKPTMFMDISFSAVSSNLKFGHGWSGPEPAGDGGLRWSLDRDSDFTLPSSWSGAKPPGGRTLVEIQIAPYLGMDPKADKRITVSVNGRQVRKLAFNRPGIIAFFVPPEAVGRPLSIGFQHPDACSPAELGLFADTRNLAFAFKFLRLWHIPEPPSKHFLPPVSEAADPADLLQRFESLGDNCEFGIVQRLCGIEPLALLRFAATPLFSLIDGLLHEFAGLGEPAAIELDLRGDKHEYILTERRYNLTYHTFVYADQMPESRVRHREAQKLALLRRRMFDDLRVARRTYVIKHNNGLPDEDVIVLFLQLCAFGPNRLLHVAPSDATHPAGSVDLLLPGLARGYIDRFAPYSDAMQVSLDCWVDLCREAEWRLGQ